MFHYRVVFVRVVKPWLLMVDNPTAAVLVMSYPQNVMQGATATGQSPSGGGGGAVVTDPYQIGGILTTPQSGSLLPQSQGHEYVTQSIGQPIPLASPQPGTTLVSSL